MWIKTDIISVPAHKSQTTEVSVNEWFIQNHSFLLGTPVANQLRGTAGGWVQTCAVEARSGQDTIALLRDRLSQILVRARGDDATSPSCNDSNRQTSTQGYFNNMATIIPADRFESNSAYAFILRENPRASGIIEIQFPLDCTEVEWKDNTRWTNTERSNIRDRISQSTSGFISVIEKEGFQQANTNPFLWCVKVLDSGVFTQKMTKARSWVNKCSRLGAYEIEASIPVEQTKSRRRKPATPASQPQVELRPNSTLTQPSGNKLADAIASVLLPQIVEAVGASQQTKELERERDELRCEVERLKLVVEELRVIRANQEMANVKLTSERDAALARIGEMESAAQELGSEVEKFRALAIELERDRDALKLTLAEVGLDPSLELTQPEPAVNWDEPATPEPVSWDDDDETSQPDDTTTQSVDWDEDLGESQLGSESKDEPDAIEEKEESEPEGFDPELLESLGEQQG
jgi:hypothetical protein